MAAKMLASDNTWLLDRKLHAARVNSCTIVGSGGICIGKKD